MELLAKFKNTMKTRKISTNAKPELILKIVLWSEVFSITPIKKIKFFKNNIIPVNE